MIFPTDFKGMLQEIYLKVYKHRTSQSYFSTTYNSRTSHLMDCMKKINYILGKHEIYWLGGNELDWE